MMVLLCEVVLAFICLSGWDLQFFFRSKPLRMRFTVHNPLVCYWINLSHFYSIVGFGHIANFLNCTGNFFFANCQHCVWFEEEDTVCLPPGDFCSWIAFAFLYLMYWRKKLPIFGLWVVFIWLWCCLSIHLVLWIVADELWNSLFKVFSRSLFYLMIRGHEAMHNLHKKLLFAGLWVIKIWLWCCLSIKLVWWIVDDELWISFLTVILETLLHNGTKLCIICATPYG